MAAKKSSTEIRLTDDDERLITVTMDIGVYRWLRETIESRRGDRSYGWIEWYQRLVDRAWEQFEAAGRESDNGPPPAAPRRVIRRVAKGGKKR